MTPKEILINNGCIIQFRDGDYAIFFKNILGNFLVFDKCLVHSNIDTFYDDDLLYHDRRMDFCDIVKIYRVYNECYFESDFENFKDVLDKLDNGLLIDYRGIELIYER